jgi:putative transposase
MTKHEQTQLWLKEGATITNEGRDYVVLALADLNLVLAKELGSGEKVLLRIADFVTRKKIDREKKAPIPTNNLWEITPEDWQVAEQRRACIAPLLASPYHKRAGALAEKIAGEANVSRATIYRWASAFRTTGLLSSLLPHTDLRGGRGKGRVAPEVEAIITDCIENFYDSEQRNSIAKTAQEIRRLCSNANFPLPALNTIRVRIQATNGRDRVVKRQGEAAAHDQHDPIKGSISDCDWPLSLVQVDHTLLPVVIVDDIHRKSIRRAWITLAIDVYSRVCLGMFLSLDAPSAMSAGMCLSHAILPKEKWLNRIGMNSIDWPCWGFMDILHVDNAREFRGNTLNLACKEHDIDLHLRPVKKPRYGAHIERLMGTVSEELKSLKGATFSGPDEKGEYDSEGNACMTFTELEQWLVLFFARYHKKVHGGIGTTPLTEWREGLLGTKKKPGRGLPARRIDEDNLRILFMPHYERTVQNYGVLIDVHYYHDVLRPYINAPHPDFPRHKQKFRFHRDPRNISQLYFYDEHTRRYHVIPYRDVSLPPVSIWEFREALKRAEELGIPRENEKAIFELINQQREIETAAAEKTKAARRKQQRRIQHEKAREETTSNLTVHRDITPSGPAPGVKGYNPDEVMPFEED